MNNRIGIISLLLIASVLCNAQTSMADKTWKHLVLPSGWNISVPDGFVREDAWGVDSYVGTVYSIKDSITLEFDIGKGNDITWNQSDCSLKNLLKKAKQDLQRKDIKRLYNIPQINRGYVDTVNGRVATIIVQQRSVEGLTCISINDCKTQSWIGLEVKSLPANKQDLVMRIFNSIDR